MTLTAVDAASIRAGHTHRIAVLRLARAGNTSQRRRSFSESVRAPLNFEKPDRLKGSDGQV
ncbi:hypothetical protein IE4771_PB00112 (plasmid) [Rhizobium etli bv. mimosae str. IE4771]|uniref:Uncharacterized protein n=1 Tax=Rhizobium etli bv. mimosae str. IE4771 TaxID=1432050 RepID=A0A060I3W3_RHIET|nr:hypothetical protein IE4771_PB00112 [Rhizobium sp. IE4771]